MLLEQITSFQLHTQFFETGPTLQRTLCAMMKDDCVGLEDHVPAGP